MPAYSETGTLPEDNLELEFVLPDGIRDNTKKIYTLGQFFQLPGGIQNQLADFITNGSFDVQFDTAINAAGTAQAVNGSLDLFKTGIGGGGIVWNTQATFIKTNYHTSAGTDGMFSFPVAGIITGIELLYIPYPAKAATVGTSATIGQVTDTADHATQPTGYNPLATARAMLMQNRWEWHWGEEDMSDTGQFWEIPASFALSGFAGAATATLVQNASFASKVRGLSKAKVIHRDEKGWFVRFISQSALAQPVDFVAQLLLRTVAIGRPRND
jgi:FAD/FMN-containing dehydrogenase